jgi:hypothetical protein
MLVISHNKVQQNSSNRLAVSSYLSPLFNFLSAVSSLGVLNHLILSRLTGLLLFSVALFIHSFYTTSPF